MTALGNSSLLTLPAEIHNTVKVPKNPYTSLQKQRENCSLGIATSVSTWAKPFAFTKADLQRKWIACKGSLSARLYMPDGLECLSAISSKNITYLYTKNASRKISAFLIWCSTKCP